MEKYYFIEALYTAGTSDENLSKLIEILDFNKDWLNQFSSHGANPLLICIETGNVKMVEYIINHFKLSNTLQDKLLKSSLIIVDKEKQHEIFKILLNLPYIDKEAIFHDGKSLFNKLIVGSHKNIFLIKKYKIPFIKKDLYGKDILFELIDHITTKKIKNLKFLLSNYTLDELVDIQHQEKNISDYIYTNCTNKKLKDKIINVINVYIQQLPKTKSC